MLPVTPVNRCNPASLGCYPVHCRALSAQAAVDALETGERVAFDPRLIA